MVVSSYVATLMYSSVYQRLLLYIELFKRGSAQYFSIYYLIIKDEMFIKIILVSQSQPPSLAIQRGDKEEMG
jgi:hypothetical protein